MRLPDGANCADLPGFVIDKYFHCNVHTERFFARTALAICARCSVMEECRQIALLGPRAPERGVIGGVTAAEIGRARAWLSYEQGATDEVPPVPRPSWLERSEAAEEVEQLRTEMEDEEEVGGLVVGGFERRTHTPAR